MYGRLLLILVLVRRDYALQFAGSLLGISWMLIQNLSLILIYTIVFLLFNRSNLNGNLYIPYILT
ncbi:MAG: ABC transporter permease, partial [Leptospira sp.]|nr:ABC transporter permease [Leptospira sp.]